MAVGRKALGRTSVYPSHSITTVPVRHSGTFTHERRHFVSYSALVRIFSVRCTVLEYIEDKYDFLHIKCLCSVII